MKKVFAFFLAIGVLNIACEKNATEPQTTAAPPQTQGPGVYCAEPVWDFGTAVEGDVLKHSFVIKNVGTETLKIQSARGSCGCTATLVSQNEVPPGGEAKIDVTVTTAGRRGPLQKTVIVASNDPRNPTLTLTVKGQVEVIAGFRPQYLNLGRMLKGKTRVETVAVEAKDPANLVLSNVSSNDPRVKARLTKTESGLPALEVTVEAGDKEGPLSAMVTADTNLEKPRQIVLRINGVVSLDLGVEPPRVFFREFKPGEEQSIDVRVQSLSGAPFRILDVTDPQNAVEGKATRDGKDWIVTLSLNRAPEKTEGAVRIRTDRKDQPQLEVPYFVGRAPAFRSAMPPLRRVAPETLRAIPKTGDAARPQ